MVFEEPPPLRVTLVLTLLRIVVGLIFAAHGWQKLHDSQAWYSQVALLGVPSPQVVAPLVIAAELLGGLGLAFGFITRLAATGILCVMVGAIGLVHWNNGVFAQHGGFEYPLALGVISLVFLTVGGGQLSMDHALRERARRRAIETDALWQRPPYVPLPDAGPYAAGSHYRMPRGARPHQA
jgi:putative oxidoreductase